MINCVESIRGDSVKKEVDYLMLKHFPTRKTMAVISSTLVIKLYSERLKYWVRHEEGYIDFWLYRNYV